MRTEDLRLILDSQKFLKHLIQSASQKTDSSSGSLLLINPNTGQLQTEASTGKSNRFSKNTKNLFQKAIADGQPIRFHAIDPEKKLAQPFSTLILPLEIQNSIIGLLQLQRQRSFSDADESEMQKWAHLASDQLKLVWDISALRLKSEQLEALVRLGNDMVSKDALANTLGRVAREACELLNTEVAVIELLNESEDHLEIKAVHGLKKFTSTISVNDSMLGVVVRRKRPVSFTNHNRLHRDALAKPLKKFPSLLAVPLAFEGKPLGILSVYKQRSHRFSNEEIRLLCTMADFSSVIIARTLLLDKIVATEEKLKASERLSALGWLAAEVAHEIRNPLTVVQMLFHTLIQNLKLHGESARDARLIESKMLQMNKILDHILTFARSSEPSMAIVNVQTMLEDLILLIRHKLTQQNIEIKKSFDPNLPTIHGDRSQLEQCLLNLVLNAAQAMPRGGTLIFTAKAKTRQNQSGITLTIKDTGEGIPKHRREKLWQPLLSYRSGGTGLGLTLVKKTIDHHGGSIRLHSRVGKGTTFEIFLPISKS
jgi:signal transduction histidine kinase